MKKLKLKALELGANEVLTRAQLKNVLGGDTGGSSTQTKSPCSGACNGVISTPNGTKSVSDTCTAPGCGCNLGLATVSKDTCNGSIS
jgi:hypothetical protein